jgi:hypothetical protein
MATDREIEEAAKAMSSLAHKRRISRMEMPSRLEEAAAALKAAERVRDTECSYRRSLDCVNQTTERQESEAVVGVEIPSRG